MMPKGWGTGSALYSAPLRFVFFFFLHREPYTGVVILLILKKVAFGVSLSQESFSLIFKRSNTTM